MLAGFQEGAEFAMQGGIIYEWGPIAGFGALRRGGADHFERGLRFFTFCFTRAYDHGVDMLALEIAYALS